MNRFKNILFICENRHVNEYILGRAIKLASDNGASLTLFHAYKESSVPSSLLDHYEQSVTDHLQTTLEQAIAQEETELSASDISIKIEKGVPYVAIIQNVIQHGYDLVFKAVQNESQSSIPLTGFSNLGMHLLRKCPSALWLYRPHKNSWDNLRIMAAIDPDENDPVRNSLNKTILELATRLRIRKNNAQLAIANCWQADGENTLRDSPFLRMSEDELDSYVESCREKAFHAWDHTLAPFDLSDPKISKHLVNADARTFIPKFVKDESIDILVMGTVARTGVKGLVIGNMAETILNEVDCSVLALKPEGYVSPLDES